MPSLTITQGPLEGQRFEFGNDVIIGRGPMADISIEDSTISRRHARLSFAGNEWILSDLRSGNGTRCNGLAVKEPVRLHDADLLVFGSVLAEFTLEKDRSEEPGIDATGSVVMLSDAEESVVQTMEPSSAVASILEDGSTSQAIDAMRGRLQIIYDVGAAIAGTFDEETLFSMILNKLFEVFPQAARGFVMIYDSEESQLIPRASLTRSGGSAEIAVSRTLVWKVIDSRHAILSVDAMEDDRFANAMTIQQLEIRSMICVPMIAQDEVFGLIHVDSNDPTKSFRKDDMALMLGIANQAALALSNARMHNRLVQQQLIEQDLALAKKIQMRFLPRNPPEIEGYEFCDTYFAALDVGGDYYDFIELPGGRIGIALGDVSGKGVSGALYMAKLSSDVRYHAAGLTSPAEILNHVNASISEEIEEGMFVTMVFFTLDPSTDHVQIASAGHPAPLVQHADGSVEMLKVVRNVPLGVNSEHEFVQTELTLQDGDTLLAYTDGVSEATSTTFEEFGEQRIVESMKASGGTPSDVVKAVLASARSFLGSAPQNDDITLVSFGPNKGRQLSRTDMSPRPMTTRKLPTI